jgi:hypothetical protein
MGCGRHRDARVCVTPLLAVFQRSKSAFAFNGQFWEGFTVQRLDKTYGEHFNMGQIIAEFSVTKTPSEFMSSQSYSTR